MLYFTYAMMLLNTFVGLILIGIILLQRGRGGGLAGAFGGMGGQSAFGNRAGDVFTRITIVLASIWIILGCVCVLLTTSLPKRFKSGTAATLKSAPADEKKDSDKVDEAAAEKATGEKMPAETDGPPAKDETKPDVKAEADPAVDDAKKPAEPEKKSVDGEAVKNATEPKPE
ncbi:MAG: preprotein translocase subunit SecG [Planctomycetes bacterium]|nr:preprotein translocase subunit SecG [Planctomycetota bacterium]